MTARARNINVEAGTGRPPKYVSRYTLTCNNGLLGAKCPESWTDDLFGPVGEARTRAQRLGWTHTKRRMDRDGHSHSSWVVMDLCPQHTIRGEHADS